MANNTETQILKIDLDDADFIKKILGAKAHMLDLGDAKNIEGLISGLTKASAVVGVLATAYFAVKTAVDWVEEAEKIKRVENQFDTLAASVGLVGSTLKEEVVKAAGGLVDEIEILESSNKTFIRLGENASHIGEIMEIARKRTVLFGGDLLQNFENLSTAMSSGQARMLKSLGIYIDTNKAQRDYAKSIGEAVGNLSEAGKRQAVFNAALADAEHRYKNVAVASSTLGVIIAQTKTQFKEIGETIAVAFEKFAGPAIRKVAGWIRDLTKDAKLMIDSVFGDDTKKAAANIELLKRKIIETDESIAKIGKHEGLLAKILPESANRAAVARLEKIKADLKVQLEGMEKEFAAMESKKAATKPKVAEGETGDPKADAKAKQDAQAKYYEEILKLRQQYEADNLASETNIENAHKHMLEQSKLLDEERHAAILKVAADTHFDKEQKTMLMLQIEENYTQKSIALAQERERVESKIIDNLAKKQDTAGKQFSNGWNANILKAKQQMNDWSSRGQAASNALVGTLAAGFKAVGDGSQTMGEAMKKYLFAALGERAVSEGTIMMLSGIWPPNPAALAGGAALVAIGGKLLSMSGGGGGGVSAGAAGAGSAGAGAPSSALTAAPTMEAGKELTGRSVALHVHGNLIDTEQNARWIMEMMRKETDTTSFDFYKVGGK